MVERIFCDVCGTEVDVEPNKAWRGLAIHPRSSDGADGQALEVDLCMRCAEGLRVTEVEQLVIGLRKRAAEEKG